MKRNLIALSTFGIALVLIGAGCQSNTSSTSNTSTNTETNISTTSNTSPSETATNAATVNIQSFAFGPQSVTVQKGGTVTFTNGASVQHSATADDGSFDTGLLSSGQTKTITFNTAGTFTYHCKVHASMTGTIIVQ